MKYFDNIRALLDAAAVRLKSDDDGFGYLYTALQELDYLLLEIGHIDRHVYRSNQRQQVRRALKWAQRERNRRRSKAGVQNLHSPHPNPSQSAKIT